MFLNTLTVFMFCVYALFFINSHCFSLTAFPGAMGFGSQTTGGRGGKIVKVTNLLDYNSHPKVHETPIPGSFRYAVQGDLPWPEIDAEPKTVVFEVSGIIRVKGQLRVGQNTTIAGQTSPAGITFYNWNRDPNVNNGLPKNDRLDETAENGEICLDNNCIIRHIRVRGSIYKGHIMGANGESTPKHNFILDHVSVSWAGDESITFYGNCTDITIQWCTIEEAMGFWHGEGGHNYGPMCAGGLSGNYSIYYTLMAHHLKRNPELQLGPGLVADVRNCVQYDANGVYHVCLSEIHNSVEPHNPILGKLNVLENYRKCGPSNDFKTKFPYSANNVSYYFPKSFADTLSHDYPELYLGGNTVVDSMDNELYRDLYCSDPWVVDGSGAADPIFLDAPVSVPFAVPSNTAEEAYDLVLAHAGAWPRDSTTRRTINETKTGAGGWVMMDSSIVIAAGQWEGWGKNSYPFPYKRFYRDDPNDWPDLPCSTDSDNDGMPDWWEDSVGLDKNTADNNGTNLNAEGYTNIEVYINALADSLVGKIPGAVTIYNKYTSFLNPSAGSFLISPNPFSGRTAIICQLPGIAGGRQVRLNIYNVMGGLVYSTRPGLHPADGGLSYRWDGYDSRGILCPAGIYCCEIGIDRQSLGIRRVTKVR
ncbi:MAG: hypothetical protein ABIA63_08245 [bacterium]